jgi:predicted lipase
MRTFFAIIVLVLMSMPVSAQSTKKEIAKVCRAQAKEQGLKGDEAKKSREKCQQERLAALPASEKKLTAQQVRMKNCSAEAKAKGLTGEEYKAFRNQCLKTKKT